ncbi:unnamed protein product [Cyprideis torosa]|uniref:Uncharacterized protein n=1 Tax=Cyprideis torosa TaxID=163714 RepID=A0A7R8ZVC1_9CRUS|nr:unnamed protein product [Cyprideis torosa]CAG0902394.1 unnamed protein product [Cyprideis torosa]
MGILWDWMNWELRAGGMSISPDSGCARSIEVWLGATAGDRTGQNDGLPSVIRMPTLIEIRKILEFETTIGKATKNNFNMYRAQGWLMDCSFCVLHTAIP